jgi:hypothetical protein
MEVRDIDALRCKHIGHATECPTGKRDIERKQRNVNAMDSNAIDHIRTACRRDYYDLVPGPLQLAEIRAIFSRPDSNPGVSSV